jgi:hypothetical protein
MLKTWIKSKPLKNLRLIGIIDRKLSAEVSRYKFKLRDFPQQPQEGKTSEIRALFDGKLKDPTSQVLKGEENKLIPSYDHIIPELDRFLDNLKSIKDQNGDQLSEHVRNELAEVIRMKFDAHNSSSVQNPRLYFESVPLDIVKPTECKYGIVNFNHGDVLFPMPRKFEESFENLTNTVKIENFYQIFLCYFELIYSETQISKELSKFTLQVIEQYTRNMKIDHNDRSFYKTLWIITNIWNLVPNMRNQFTEIAQIMKSEIDKRASLANIATLFPQSEFDINLFNNYIVLFDLLQKHGLAISSEMQQELYDFAFANINFELMNYKEGLNVMKVLTDFIQPQINSKRLVCGLCTIPGLSLISMEKEELLVFIKFCTDYQINNYFLNSKYGFGFYTGFDSKTRRLKKTDIDIKMLQALNIFDYFSLLGNNNTKGNLNLRSILLTCFKGLENFSEDLAPNTDENYDGILDILNIFLKHIDSFSFVRNFLPKFEHVFEKIEVDLILKSSGREKFLDFVNNLLTHLSMQECSYVSSELFKNFTYAKASHSLKKSFDFCNQFYIELSVILLAEDDLSEEELMKVLNFLSKVDINVNDESQAILVTNIFDRFRELVAKGSKDENQIVEFSQAIEFQKCLNNLMQFVPASLVSRFEELDNLYLGQIIDKIKTFSFDEIVVLLENFESIRNNSDILNIVKARLAECFSEIFKEQPTEAAQSLDLLEDIKSEELNYPIFLADEKQSLHKLLPLMYIYSDLLSGNHLKELEKHLQENASRLIGRGLLAALFAIPKIFPEDTKIVSLLLRNALTSMPSYFHINGELSFNFELYLDEKIEDFLYEKDNFKLLINFINNNKISLETEAEQLSLSLLLQIYLKKTQKLDLEILADVFSVLRPRSEYEYRSLKPLVAESWFPLENITFERLMAIPLNLFSPSMLKELHSMIDFAIDINQIDKLVRLMRFFYKNRAFHLNFFECVLNQIAQMKAFDPEIFSKIETIEVPDLHFEKFYTNLFINLENLNLKPDQLLSVVFNYISQRDYILYTDQEIKSETISQLNNIATSIAEELIIIDDIYKFKTSTIKGQMKHFRPITENFEVRNNLFFECSPPYLRIDYSSRSYINAENQIILPFNNFPTDLMQSYKPVIQRVFYFHQLKELITDQFELSSEDLGIIMDESRVVMANFAHMLSSNRRTHNHERIFSSFKRCEITNIYIPFVNKKNFVILSPESSSLDISDPKCVEKEISIIGKMLISQLVKHDNSKLANIEVITPEEFYQLSIEKEPAEEGLEFE